MADLDWTEAELDAEYARAVRAGRRDARTEPRATAARYEPATRRLVIELASGATFIVPVDLLEGLAGAPAQALDQVEVTPAGEGLHFPELDADLSVPGLLGGSFGSKAWMRALGREPAGAPGSPPKAGEVDLLIGRRIRERRLMLGLTVADLAARLGIPHQQVRKHETGASRLSAGQLYQVAEALGVEVGYFFSEGGAEQAVPTAQRRMLLELVRNFARIADPQRQEMLASLARSMAGLDDAASDESGESGPVAVRR